MFFAIHGLLMFTVLAVIGFIVLVAASKCGGLLSLWGKLLGAWLYLLAILALVFHVIGPLLGWHMMGHGPGMRRDHPRWEMPAPPPPSATAPEQPEAPATPPSDTPESAPTTP